MHVVGVRDSLRYTSFVGRNPPRIPFRRSPPPPPPNIIDGAHLPRLIYNIILCRRNMYNTHTHTRTAVSTEPARLCNRNTLLGSRPLWAANARPSFLWTYKRRNIVGLSRRPVMTLYVYIIQYRQINLLIRRTYACIYNVL